MRDFKHWPNVLAASAVIATQVLCTWWMTSAISSNEPEYYGGVLERIELETAKMAGNTIEIEMRTKAIESALEEEFERRARQDMIRNLSR
jgi:hypothetical protein